MRRLNKQDANRFKEALNNMGFMGYLDPESDSDINIYAFDSDNLDTTIETIIDIFTDEIDIDLLFQDESDKLNVLGRLRLRLKDLITNA